MHVPVHRRIFMLCFFLFVLHVPLCFFLPQLQILKCLVFCKAGFVFLLLVAPVSHFLTVNVSYLSTAFICSCPLMTPSSERAARLTHATKSRFWKCSKNLWQESAAHLPHLFPREVLKKSLFWLRIYYCICAEFPLCICFYLTGKESLVNQ